MPNRIIKESIHVSEKIAKLTDFQFRLWTSLVTYVDDYGRGDARPPIIKGAAFPLREEVTAADIERGLFDLEKADCIRLYEVEGRPYLFFPNWEAHQRIQTKRSKFPPPVSTVGDGEYRLNPNPNPNPYPNQAFAQRAPLRRRRQKKRRFCVRCLLNGGGEFDIDRRQADEWAALYPAVDVAAQLRAMKGWLIANPKRQKTGAGIARFINSWLAKEQDRGGKKPPGGQNGRDDAPRSKVHGVERQADVSRKRRWIGVSRDFCCPYYLWEEPLCVYCEGGKLRFRDIAHRRDYVYRYCAAVKGFEACSVAAAITKSYERSEKCAREKERKRALRKRACEVAKESGGAGG